MDELKEEIVQIYGEGKHIYLPGTWKEDSDRLFGPNEAIAVWNQLIEQELIPAPQNELVFVSPASNYPTHEVAIFQNDCITRTGQSRFFVGDIGNVDPKPLLRDMSANQSYTHQFLYSKWDAENLPIADNSADVILDRKGWLWFLATKGDKDRITNTFRNYHKHLKQGGIVILDNITDYALMPNNTINDQTAHVILRNKYLKGKIPGVRPSELYPKAIGQYEASTVEFIDKQTPEIWDDLKDLYDIRDIGEGVSKVRVLQKKA